MLRKHWWDFTVALAISTTVLIHGAPMSWHNKEYRLMHMIAFACQAENSGPCPAEPQQRCWTEMLMSGSLPEQHYEQHLEVPTPGMTLTKGWPDSLYWDLNQTSFYAASEPGRAVWLLCSMHPVLPSCNSSKCQSSILTKQLPLTC